MEHQKINNSIKIQLAELMNILLGKKRIDIRRIIQHRHRINVEKTKGWTHQFKSSPLSPVISPDAIAGVNFASTRLQFYLLKLLYCIQSIWVSDLRKKKRQK